MASALAICGFDASCDIAQPQIAGRLDCSDRKLTQGVKWLAGQGRRLHLSWLPQKLLQMAFGLPGGIVCAAYAPFKAPALDSAG